MAIACESIISVVGLKEPPETFVKALSKSMFGIDLDDMEVENWGCERGDDGKFYDITLRVDHRTRTTTSVRKEADPKTWYAELLNDREIRLCVLYPREPFVKCGVSVPRFYVLTKWPPPYEQMKNASEAFPDLLFHVRWFIEQDGPSGEFVLKGGKRLEETVSGASWYLLFDNLNYPSMSLLPKYMPLTLAQRGAAAVDDAIELVKRLHCVIHSPRFAESRYQPFRDQRKFEETREALDTLLAYMQIAANSLTFEGVFLPDMTDAETEVRNEDEDLKRMNVEEVRP